MKPAIFKEQIEALSPPATESLSLDDFKIDYSQCLGWGTFGKVYALVPRPANEMNRFSRWLPYVYDWIYPVQTANDNKYCVKISYTFVESVVKDFVYHTDSVLASFSERAIQNKSAQLRNQYGISQITIYATNSWRAQIKSRVIGQTLNQFIENGELLAEKNFIMRKAFVDFLWAIASTPLYFDDLHASNIMYNTVQQQWEIVDGATFKKSTYNAAKARVEFLAEIKWSLLPFKPEGKIARLSSALLKNLFNIAIETVRAEEFSQRHYDAFVDRKCLLQAYDAVTIPKEFHFLTSINRKGVSRPSTHAEFLRRLNKI